MFHDFDDPKTLTFLVGGRDQSLVNEGEIELKDIEDWFVDGRDRSFRMRWRVVDVGEAGRLLGGQYFLEWVRDRGFAHGEKMRDDWEGFNVRVITWKKGD